MSGSIKNGRSNVKMARIIASLFTRHRLFYLRLILVIHHRILNRAHQRLSLQDLAKHHVLSVEMWGGLGGDEELRVVGVWAAVCLYKCVREA